MAELEEKVAKVEGLIEGIVPRLDRLERELESIRAEMRDNFRWTVGLIFGTWVSVMLGIIAILFK